MENTTDVVKLKKLINIPNNSYIRVDWQDYPENRTLETVNKVKTYFSEKYELPKSSIKLNFIPIIKNTAGKVVDITEGLIDNIMDTAYQRGLFSQWVKLNDIEPYWYWHQNTTTIDCYIYILILPHTVI